MCPTQDTDQAATVKNTPCVNETSATVKKSKSQLQKMEDEQKLKRNTGDG